MFYCYLFIVILVLLNLFCLFICVDLTLDVLDLHLLNMNTGENLGDNFNPGNNNPGGGSNPGGNNNPEGSHNVMSIKNILNEAGSTLSPAQMYDVLTTKHQALLTERRLNGIRTTTATLNDLGYNFAPNQYINPDGTKVDPDKQTLLNLYRDNKDLFYRNRPGHTNTTRIIEYYRNNM